MLNRLNIGCKMESNEQTSHLLYMDDLKIFTRTEAHLSKPFSTVKIFTDDISMEFDLRQVFHFIAVTKGGKQIRSQNMPIDDKTSIRGDVQIPRSDENSGIQHSAMKEKIGILSPRNNIPECVSFSDQN